MANTFKIKTNDAMPTSAGTPLTLYTVPSSTTTIVLGLMLCNVDTSQRLVDVHIESNTSDNESNSNVHATYSLFGANAYHTALSGSAPAIHVKTLLCGPNTANVGNATETIQATIA